MILINKDNIELNHIFDALFYSFYWISSNIFTISNFNINKAIFGNDFPFKCILGLPLIDALNFNTPKLLFDIEYTLGSIINGY